MAFGLTSLVGTIGSIFSPYATSFSANKLKINPMITVGVFALVCAFISWGFLIKKYK